MHGTHTFRNSPGILRRSSWLGATGYGLGMDFLMMKSRLASSILFKTMNEHPTRAAKHSICQGERKKPEPRKIKYQKMLWERKKILRKYMEHQGNSNRF